MTFIKSYGRAKTVVPVRMFVCSFSSLLLSLLLRRYKVFLLLPIVYISSMLLFMGVDLLPRAKKFDHVAVVQPGSIYRSPQVFEHLWPAMQMQNSSSSSGIMAAWQYPNKGDVWSYCIQQEGHSEGLPMSNGYLIIEANGGLNQQRSSICNAVAVAALLNATLVIPKFHKNSVWKDTSTFGEIYDEEHFVKMLENDVRIVKKLPDDVMENIGNLSNIFHMKIKAWSKPSFYLENILPKLSEKGIIRIAPFANRLSFDNIPSKIQQLRCRTNFEALRFAESIFNMGEVLMKRMIKHSSISNGKYMAVHLRFEEDMVAFSCCTYDGGEEEKKEMEAARERGWRGKFTRPGRVLTPGFYRIDGRCPLTPMEVGMMLRGMGFQNSTPIYIAAGKLYKEDKYMLPLRQMFPHLQTKETLLSEEELAPFKRYSSRLAALDYTVCLNSEVFVTTQGGNFPHFLAGHRRFLNKGHAKTIRPDKRKLALLLDNPTIRWEVFTKHLMAMHRQNDVKGHELRKLSSSIYEYPAPDCMCSQNIKQPNT